MRGSLFILLLLTANCGCQCCGITEWYQDKVDCISDYECHADGLYHPCLDLTRIRCHRCALDGATPDCRLCENKASAKKTEEPVTTIAIVQQAEEPEFLPPEVISEAKPDEETELEKTEEIQWIHFEPLPAVDVSGLDETESVLPQTLFEAHDPVTAPLSIKPNPNRSRNRF